MASKEMLMTMVVATMLFGLAVATDHTIGGPSGWTIGSDLQTWSASQSFLVGDNLVFAYPSAFHDVVEVSKAEFDNCQAVKPLATFSNGNTIVPLTSPGKRYFICGMPGHCTQGMKLEVNILPNANAATASPNASLQPPLPNSGNAVLPPIAPPPSTLPSVVPPQPLLPLNPAGVVPILSPSTTPLPAGVSSSLPLIPALSPESSPAVTSLPSFPGSPSTTSSKTSGNFPTSGTTSATADLSPPVDSSVGAKTVVVGFGWVLGMMMVHLF